MSDRQCDLGHQLDLLEESVVFHGSSDGSIAQFVPQRFWHVDYVRSGRVRTGRTPPREAAFMDGFFATERHKLPFYFLPREMPRLWVSLEGLRDDACMSLRRYFGESLSLEHSALLIIDADTISTLTNHQVYVYCFVKEHFRSFPTGEFFAEQTCKPKYVLGPFDCLEALAQERIKLMHEPSLFDCREALLKNGVDVHAEKVRNPKLEKRNRPV